MQILAIGGNQITEVPDAVGRLHSLQALVLSDNLIEQLPPNIANLKQMRSLLIDKNRLKTLPTQIIKLKCLTEVSSRKSMLNLAFIASTMDRVLAKPNCVTIKHELMMQTNL